MRCGLFVSSRDFAQSVCMQAVPVAAEEAAWLQPELNQKFSSIQYPYGKNSRIVQSSPGNVARDKHLLNWNVLDAETWL